MDILQQLRQQFPEASDEHLAILARGESQFRLTIWKWRVRMKLRSVSRSRGSKRDHDDLTVL